MFFRCYIFIGLFLLVFCFEESEIHADEITMETQELFDAVRLGSLTAVEKSLYAGADLSRKNIDGLTPIDVAINYSNFEIAHYLLALRK